MKRVADFINWINKHRKTCLGAILFIILARFVFLIYYNWNCGNTGSPGVQYYVDSYRYLDGAQNLLDGKPFGHKEAEYMGYISLLAFVKWAGLPMTAIVALQIFVALVSAWFLFDMAKRISGSSFAGIIAVGLYIANPFITVWHLYILTESLYTSLVIISAWGIAKACGTRSFKNYVVAFIIVIVTATIRPNGWILIPLALCAFIAYSDYKPLIKYTGFVAVAFTFLISMACIPKSNNIIQKVERNITMNDLLTSGEVVWGHPEIRISMPQDSSLHNQNWAASYGYILKHPFACLKLATYRISSELLEIDRPWYSLRYSILLYLWLWPAYLLAIAGAIHYRREVGITIVMLIILAHLLIIALTYAEHEHRFLNYFLPLIYAISACGIAFLLKSMFFRYSRK